MTNHQDLKELLNSYALVAAEEHPVMVHSETVIETAAALSTLLDEREALVGEVEGLREALQHAAFTIDVADNWFASHLGEDPPSQWSALVRRLAEYRAALSETPR